MLENNGEVQPYEQYAGNSTYLYSNFSRFRDILPQYIFSEMIGISPQKRRSFLLQNKYLMSLSFNYSMLEMFKKTGYYILLFLFIKILWENWLSRYHALVFLFLALILGYYLCHKWAQSKNTRTIREEVVFYGVSDVIGMIFASLSVFSEHTLSLF